MVQQPFTSKIKTESVVESKHKPIDDTVIDLTKEANEIITINKSPPILMPHMLKPKKRTVPYAKPITPVKKMKSPGEVCEDCYEVISFSGHFLCASTYNCHFSAFASVSSQTWTWHGQKPTKKIRHLLKASQKRSRKSAWNSTRILESQNHRFGKRSWGNAVRIPICKEIKVELKSQIVFIHHIFDIVIDCKCDSNCKNFCTYSRSDED